MNGNDIKNLIEALPALILYIVPGFIFLGTLSFLMCKDLKFNKEYISVSIVISFIIINIEKYIYIHADIYSPLFVIVTVLISILSAYVIERFTKSKCLDKILKKLNIKRTINHNIFADIKDDEYGVWLRVHIPTEKIVYLGTLTMFENNSKYEESFLILSNYKTYAYADSPIYKECFIDEHKTTNWVAIKIKDINRIEIVYSEDSEKIK